MIAQIYIDTDHIGEVILKEIDRSMGVVGGKFLPTDLYKKYKKQIQEIFEKSNRCANVTDYNFRAILHGIDLKPEGGICLGDAIDFDEIDIEICGIHWEIIDRVISDQINR